MDRVPIEAASTDCQPFEHVSTSISEPNPHRYWTFPRDRSMYVHAYIRRTDTNVHAAYSASCRLRQI